MHGCVPKKLFVLGSRIRDEIEAAGFGWTIGQVSFDWPTMIATRTRRSRSIHRYSMADLKRHS